MHINNIFLDTFVKAIGSYACRLQAILLTLLLFSSAGFNNYSLAQSIQGAQSSRFKQAISTWLDNKDDQSLPVLAELALEGNLAARLFLARIERTERELSNFLFNLSLQQRHALFRSPQSRGKFRLTWLQVEENLGNPLAKALSRSALSYVDLETIKILRSYGEILATDHLIRSASFHGDDEVRSKLLDGLTYENLLPFVRSQTRPIDKYSLGLEALRQVIGGETPVPADNISQQDKEAILFLALGSPFGKLDKANPWTAVIEQWLQNNEAVKPIHDICSQQCPHEVNSCAVNMLGLTGGYYEAIKLKTPLESIVSQSTYLKSTRAQLQVVRQAALRRAEDGSELVKISELSKKSQCLANLITTERASIE